MLGTGPVNAPVSRFLDRKSYKVERHKDDNGLTIPYVGKAYNMLVGGRPTDQFYPRGGVQTIVDALSYSLPDNVKINLGEELVKVNTEQQGRFLPKVNSVTTNKGTYETDLVIYSGYATDIPALIDTPLPSYYVDNLKKIEKVNSLSVWLGLDEPIFKDEGSEMWVSTSPDTLHTWMIPTSNYDPSLAPKDKHLVGFAFIVPSDMPHEKAEEKARHTIFSNIPALERYMNMIHYQHLVPEKATWSIHAGFGDIKTPIRNLYCVGSDSFKRSMGLTRASYSVHKMLDTLGVDKNLTY
jgi:phytoene dehydrogenase-like protein